MSRHAGPSATAPAPELIDAGFAVEVADAPLLHAGLNLADLAHVLALHERGVLPPDAAAALARLLLETHERPMEEFPYDPVYGETYNCRERVFSERLGRVAGWLHAGRPRREAVRVALRLRLRRDVAALVRDAAAFAEAVSDQAERNAETLLADQTYLQQAQPSTFGHYLLAFAYPALRDAARLEDGLAWINRSPSGAGCVNGSRLVRDRERLAALLGFDSVIEHTRDAMWQIDGLLDVVGSATSLVTTLAKLAEDLEIYSSQEFDYVDLAGPYTRASVLMPQKRNPYALSVIRGEAGVLIGRLAGLFAVMKSPSARSDNLIFAYGEVPRAVDVAGRATRLMRGVVATLSVNADRMAEALMTGFSQATDLAEHVMETCGVDYRSAYLITGGAIRRASEAGLRGLDVTGDLLDEAARDVLGEPLGIVDSDLEEALDPRRIVRGRDVAGGAAPEVVRGMAADCREQARSTAARAAARLGAFDEAEAALLAAARDLAGEDSGG